MSKGYKGGIGLDLFCAFARQACDKENQTFPCDDDGERLSLKELKPDGGAQPQREIYPKVKDLPKGVPDGAELYNVGFRFG